MVHPLGIPVSSRSVLQRLKPLVRDTLAHGLYASRLTRPERGAADRLTITTFHRVLPAEQIREYVMPVLAMTPEEFSWHIGYFRRHFECETLRDAVRRFVDRERTDKPLLAVTFDDGQLDNFTHAKPVLDQFGVKASFFVPVDAVERRQPLWHDRLGHSVWRAALHRPERVAPIFEGLGLQLGDTLQAVEAVISRAKSLSPEDRLALCERADQANGGAATPAWDGFMSWDQLRTLIEEGHEVGSHSMRHEILPLCSDSELEREIVDSRSQLEHRLGSPVSSFCYPNGDTDARVCSVVERAGYRQAVTTRWGTNDHAVSTWALKRCDMTSEHARDRHGRLSAARLAWRMSRLHPGLK